MMATAAAQQTGLRYARSCSYRPLGRKPIDGRFSVVLEPCSRFTSRSKDSVKIDDTCGTDNFLTNTNNDRIVKAERGNAKYMEVNA